MKANRDLFLRSLYSLVKGSTSGFFDKYQLGEKLGNTKEETDNIVSYLVKEDLLTTPGLGPFISLTHTGLKKVEGLSDQSIQARTGNIITIGTMQNSAIQQGSPNAQQTFTLTQHNQTHLRSFLQELEKSLDKLPVSLEEKHELEAEIQTVKTQLQSPKPKNAIINVSLNTFRSILESITANLYTANLIEMLQHLF